MLFTPLVIFHTELNEFNKQTTLNLFFKRVRQVARNLQVAIFSIFLNQALILQSELGRDIEQIFFAVLVSDIQYRSNELYKRERELYLSF